MLVSKNGNPGHVKGTPPQKVRKKTRSPPDAPSSGDQTTTASEPSQGSAGGDLSGRPALTRRRLFQNADKGKAAGDGESGDSPKEKNAVPKSPKPKGLPRSRLSAAKSKAGKECVRRVKGSGKGEARAFVKRSQSAQQVPGPGAGTSTTMPERPESDAARKRESQADLSDALNRASTADELLLTDDEIKERKKEAKKEKKLQKRDKAVHARKMRFYRSLDSTFLRIFSSTETSMIFGSFHACNIVPE